MTVIIAYTLIYMQMAGRVKDRLCGLVVRDFLATDPDVPGSTLGATRFSETQWVWNGVHSAS
jgi:hypothetical protein